jgi:hypothetical protein
MPPISQAAPRVLRFLQQRVPETPTQRHDDLVAYVERQRLKGR